MHTLYLQYALLVRSLALFRPGVHWVSPSSLY
jgi:hypothetical protein